MSVREELMNHVPRLRRYARALVRNQELADDLVQDTLERALRHTNKFACGSDMRAWLFTIMHNVFANHKRRAESKVVHVSVDEDVHDGSHFAVASHSTRSLEMRDLDFALQRLPIEQRQVVLLVGLEEMTYAEVAVALEIPLGTVMSRLSRGRERLRNLMAGKQDGAQLKVVK